MDITFAGLTCGCESVPSCIEEGLELVFLDRPVIRAAPTLYKDNYSATARA
jgi:hypothetical protein